MLKHISRILIFLMLFTACGQLEISTDEQVERSLSVNFLLVNDGDPWSCFLTKTKSLQDSFFFDKVPDASISLASDNLLFTNFSELNQRNRADVPIYSSIESTPFIASGDICVLEISHGEYPSISAIDTMPVKPIINDLILDNIQIEESLSSFQNFNISGEYTIELSLANDHRYYQLEIKTESNIYQGSIGAVSIDGTLLNVVDSAYYKNLYVSYDDINIDGVFNTVDMSKFDGNETKVLKGTFSGRVLRKENDFENIIVDVKTISSTYFKYLESLDESIENQSNVFTLPKASFNNIENGYGAFVLSNVERKIIPIF